MNLRNEIYWCTVVKVLNRFQIFINVELKIRLFNLSKSKSKKICCVRSFYSHIYYSKGPVGTSNPFFKNHTILNGNKWLLNSKIGEKLASFKILCFSNISFEL